MISIRGYACSFLPARGAGIEATLFFCSVCAFFFFLPLRTDATATILIMTILAAWTVRRRGMAGALFTGGARVPLLAFAVLVCVALAASVMNPETLAKFPRVLLWACLVFSGVALSACLPGHDGKYFWVLFAAIVGSALAAEALFGFTSPRFWHDGRLKLFAMHPSRLGVYCSVCFFFLLYRAVASDRKARIPVLVCALFILAILIATNTRANLLMLPLGVVCLVPALPRKFLKPAAMALVLSLCLGGTALYMSNSTATARLVSVVTNPFSDLTFKSRVPIWELGWKFFTEAPVIGHGIQSYQAMHPRYIKEHKAEMDARYEIYEPNVKQAHNIILGRMVETGAVGAAAFLIFYCGAIVAAWRGPKENRWLFAVLIFYLAMNMFDDGLFRINDAFILFVAGTALGAVLKPPAERAPD